MDDKKYMEKQCGSCIEFDKEKCKCGYFNEPFKHFETCPLGFLAVKTSVAKVRKVNAE